MQAEIKLLFLLAYDGTRYYGWQKTKEGPSVEAEVEHAASTILREPVTLQAASRTDRGVHARGQVVDCSYSSISTDLHRFLLSMNGLLPNDIRLMRVAFAPHETFHPTTSSIKKQYLYRIVCGPVCPPHLVRTHWHVPFPIHEEAVREALPLFVGEHDFKGFSNFRKGLVYPHTRRTLFKTDLQVNCFPDYQEWTFLLEGDHFLYKMARTIVGTLVSIGRGKLAPSIIPQVFYSKARIEAGLTAPAHGLELFEVFYNEILWKKRCT